jgi:hypothetical protein
VAVQNLVSLDDVPERPALPAAAAPVPAEGPPSLPGDGTGVAPPSLPAELSEAGARTTGGATAAGGPAPAVPGAAAADVDALVRRLYDPLARRLRAELRLDRERVGRALDLRH